MDKYKIWFILLKISEESKVKLIEKYNNEENIYNNIDNIINENEINRFFISRLKHRNTIEEEAFEEYLHKNGIKYVTLASELYPQKLKSINNPPYVLFYKGDL
ncbi:hypothetical protein [uncultured Clostridium sp.]|nr:hypothetical protein [uncultured Clostridium sp.]